MSRLAARVATLTGADPARMRRLAGGDLSEVLLVERRDGRLSVAKGGLAAGAEAAMLRSIAAAGAPAPAVEAEHDGLLMIEHVENDGIFSERAWADLGNVLRRLHGCHGESYGWPVDYRLGTVELPNQPAADWPLFFAERRLIPTASVLDRPWRERVAALAGRIGELLPAAPAPSHLHGDLWTGNILVRDGKVAALIDPACYHGDGEADLAMLTLFGSPPPAFWGRYGSLEPGWEQRRIIYQLFPALLHLRLFGASYAPMVDRLLAAAGF